MLLQQYNAGKVICKSDYSDVPPLIQTNRGNFIVGLVMFHGQNLVHVLTTKIFKIYWIFPKTFTVHLEFFLNPQKLFDSATPKLHRFTQNYTYCNWTKLLLFDRNQWRWVEKISTEI